mmetsp:Transcript_30456/g.78702  ORF Transcript_30456/g.78702 Transcript_30456/m.78702 type:complete len:231 (-) Transcript_30456:822-1514(-)
MKTRAPSNPIRSRISSRDRWRSPRMNCQMIDRTALSWCFTITAGCSGGRWAWCLRRISEWFAGVSRGSGTPCRRRADTTLLRCSPIACARLHRSVSQISLTRPMTARSWAGFLASTSPTTRGDLPANDATIANTSNLAWGVVPRQVRSRSRNESIRVSITAIAAGWSNIASTPKRRPKITPSIPANPNSMVFAGYHKFRNPSGCCRLACRASSKAARMPLQDCWASPTLT